jgi:rSAM/selenodomain-associated transferase 1
VPALFLVNFLRQFAGMSLGEVHAAFCNNHAVPTFNRCRPFGVQVVTLGTVAPKSVKFFSDKPLTIGHMVAPMASIVPNPHLSPSTSIGLTRRVLGVFAKQPVPGQVKTRLAADTSPEFASQVAAAFLAEWLDRLVAIDARRVLVFAPAGAQAYFSTASAAFELVPQEDGDLGRRLESFVAAELIAGAEAVVVVGADAPTLPTAFIELAFGQLADNDLVLGPATDGGYYLVGCARRLPPIFSGIAWSGSTVLEETVARLADSSIRLALLPPWYDVDALDDWRMLRGHLAALRRAGLDPGVPRIESLCQSGPR